MSEGEKNAIAVFHEAAQRVPAYRDFLRRHGVRHESIQSIPDFLSVPIATKENYIRQYPCLSGASVDSWQMVRS